MLFSSASKSAVTKPAKIYKEKDADKNVLKSSTLAVIGFGSQGHAHALNLRDSGYRVIVGLPQKSNSAGIARKMGFEVVSDSEAARRADVVLLAAPDMLHGQIYSEAIEPNLRKGKTLLLAHGLSVHFGLMLPRADINVALVAPRGPGHIVRAQYSDGMGVPALIAVHSGGALARKIALAWADGIGATRAGVLETTFKEETETDLFGEQAVLCGGLMALIQAGFETLVKAGYKPETAYFQCCNELKFIADLINQSGISGMRFSVSDTANYGDLTRGTRVVNSSSRRAMEKILREIQSGKFVKEWQDEYKSGLKISNRLLKESEKHPMEKVGQRLRSLMPWAAKANANTRDAQASFMTAEKK